MEGISWNLIEIFVAEPNALFTVIGGNLHAFRRDFPKRVAVAAIPEPPAVPPNSVAPIPNVVFLAVPIACVCIDPVELLSDDPRAR